MAAKKTHKSQRYADFFNMDGKSILLEEKDLGIFNGQLTVNVPYTRALALGGMWAPPYVSSDFSCEVRLFNESVVADSYTWSPRQVCRKGSLNGIKVESTLALAQGSRGAILAFTLTSAAASKVEIPLSLHLLGTFAYNDVWDFFKQKSEPAFTDPYNYSRRAGFFEKDGAIVWSNADGGIVVRAALPGLANDGYCPCWRSTVWLKPGQSRIFYISFGMGTEKNARRLCKTLAANPKKAIEASKKHAAAEIADIFTKLPTLTAQNKQLEALYNRSLVLFIMNKWHVPEFLLDPYYSTGGINGGCACSFLYDFSEGWEITNLYDPDALREHVRVFLKMGLGKHFAFLPMTGQPYGPWYPVNQEKIIFLIYYYVHITGDKAFLLQEDNGKTVLDQLIAQATHGDDLAKPVALIDYGKGNNHLELRRQYLYNNYLPDLNARRYANYNAVADLCDIVGRDSQYLRTRAQELKTLITAKMWNKKLRWFHHFDENWEKDIRYTVQMFKLIGSGVLDKQQEEGLLSHLNEREFLSACGLHSMSKLDIAYDQLDIDNGGGGICTCFPPQIIERLYKAGRPAHAENILKRILWWGQRMPYWGDSFVATAIDYRRDTSLQNAIGGVSVAQCIIFGMFGVKVDAAGTITVNPAPPKISPKIALRDLKIRDRCIDIEVAGPGYTVTVDGKTTRSKVGSPVVIPPSASCFEH